MSIVRIEHNKTNPYVMLNKKVLEDESLSWAAKGLWAYLLSKPDHWKVSVAHLSKIYDRKGGGERAVYSLLNELIENGYCLRQQENTGGSFGKVEYVVLEFKKCLPHRSQADARQADARESAYSNKGDIENKESSSKEEPEKKEDDDLIFSDKQKEDLNNYSSDQIDQALKITQENCLQSKNSTKVKYFFTTIRNLKEKPKNTKISPFEELSKNFKKGQLYNNAECNITENAIAFTRGMKHEEVDFKYFSWDNFQKLCDSFGISFKR